jgi:DNA-binding MarR family transcriptional regulator
MTDVASDPGSRSGATARLGYLFKHAERRMNELNAAALAPLGTDARELGILQVLADQEPMSQLQAARRLGIDRTTMVAMLDTLEGKGLVSRHPHPTDRRRNLVELSEAGRTVVESGTRASDDAERELLSVLSPPAAQALRDALGAVVRRAPH